MDTNTTPSIPYTIRYRTTITTDANGNKVVQFRPSLYTFVLSSATVDAGTGIVSAWNVSQEVPEFSDIYAMFSQYRIVSYGLRVFCSAAMSDSQGQVLMALSREDSTFNVSTTNYTDYKVFGLNGLDATMISKSTGPESDQWTPVNTSAERLNMYVAITGGAVSTAVAGIEVTLNVEFTPLVGLGARLVTPSPAVPRSIKDAQERVERRVPAIMDGPSEVRSKTMMDYAAEAVSWAVDHPAEVMTGLAYLGI
jgi:hypothetical protein